MHSTVISRLGLALLALTTLQLTWLTEPTQACDIVGASACPHKPDADLKEENLEEYCQKYKQHLECVYKKYKGCDKKEKYVEAMESMVKGLRKRARQLEKVCEMDVGIPDEEDDEGTAADGGAGGGDEEDEDDGGKKKKGKKKSKGGAQDVRQNGHTTQKSTSTLSPCKVNQISANCHPILTNIQFSSVWNGIIKQRWCNSAGSYHTCLKSHLLNCYGNIQYAESISYYENMMKYVHSQANINCPGGLEGCLVNSNDVRCKLGVKFGEANHASSRLSTELLNSIVLPILMLAYFYTSLHSFY